MWLLLSLSQHSQTTITGISDGQSCTFQECWVSESILGILQDWRENRESVCENRYTHLIKSATFLRSNAA